MLFLVSGKDERLQGHQMGVVMFVERRNVVTSISSNILPFADVVKNRLKHFTVTTETASNSNSYMFEKEYIFKRIN